MFTQRKTLNFGNYVPNDKVLNRKVPENPRYRHVKSAIDTGRNVKRHVDELKEKQKYLNLKSDEVFKRMKLSHFLNLVIISTKEIHQESIKGDANDNHEENRDKNIVPNVLMGYGEIDLQNEKKKLFTASSKKEKLPPYLLLDVRDKENFLQHHIKTARHYPSAMLSRSSGYEIDEMKLYKRFGIIIVYDEDESISTKVATTLIQRGYNDVYVLSGGLKFIADSLPRRLLSTLCSKPCMDIFAGPYSNVLVKYTTNEYFSTDDIASMEQYIEVWPNRGSLQCNGYPRSYTSYSKQSHATPRFSQNCSKQSHAVSHFSQNNSNCTMHNCIKHNCTKHNSTLLYGSTSFKRSSLVSNNNSVSCRKANDGKTKPMKKAPWK